jgi:PAS domain S-box-containing protein
VIHEDGSNYAGNTHPVQIVMVTRKPVNNAIMGVYRPTTQDRVWLLVNAEPQFDNFGQFSSVFVTLTNITYYKKVQDELSIKNNILHSIDEFSIDIMSIIDEHGKHIYVSKSATTISGFSNQILMQMNATDLVPAKDKQHMQAVLNTVPVVGKLENVLGKLVCKDGSIKYISWSLRWDAVARMMYVNGRDKTLEILNERAIEAIRVTNELQIKDAIFEKEEQKRKDIGYELHENVGQLIATVKVYLDSYEKSANETTLQKSKDLLSVCIDELRTITYINSIPNFKNVGFANAIEILMQLKFKKYDIVHALDVAVNEANISDSNRINIYRLMQLWLGHIVQREGLLSVVATIIDDKDSLMLQIIDEVSNAQNYTDYLSQDLMPIKERLKIIGGSMSMRPSEDNKCFTITFLLKKEVTTT